MIVCTYVDVAACVMLRQFFFIMLFKRVLYDISSNLPLITAIHLSVVLDDD